MKQSSRLFFTILYLIILLFLARFITNEWFVIPTGDSGLWFQAGLLMVVLGSFFIEKHFTKPVDVVTNVAAGIVTLISLENNDKFLYWNVVMIFMIGLGFAAFVSMTIQTFVYSPWWRKVGNILFVVSTFLGSAKRFFSVVLILSVFSYFEIPSVQALWVLLFWVGVIISEPIGLTNLFESIVDKLYSKETNIGKVWKILGDKVIQIEMMLDLGVPTSKILEVRIGNNLQYFAPVGEFYLVNKKIVTAIKVYDDKKQGDENQLKEIDNYKIVNLLDDKQVPDKIKTSVEYLSRNSVLGFVDDNTSIKELRFKLLSNQDLKVGYLVKVYLKDKPVIFQIVNGFIKSQSHDGDQESYISVIAQQVGEWNNEKFLFSSVDWIPRPGSPVFIENMGEMPIIQIDTKRKEVGKLPNSHYPVHVGIHDIVTHHTAILGITGSGKTYLAYDLIRKMVQSKIKVIIFDVSNDYRKDLADLNPTMLTVPSESISFLNDINSYIAIAEFKINNSDTLVRSTAVAVKSVLEWGKANLSSQKGENIEARICIVFEEAHSLIPEWNSVSVKGDSEEVNKISQAILQGRKYGIGALVITQRTANITKTILNQCNTIFALQSFDQTGLEFLKNYIGDDHASALSTLIPRQAVLFGKASSSRRPVIIKLSEHKIELEETIISPFSSGVEITSSN